MGKTDHDQFALDEFMKSRLEPYVQTFTRSAENEDESPEDRRFCMLFADVSRYLCGYRNISEAAFKEKVTEIERPACSQAMPPLES